MPKRLAICIGVNQYINAPSANLQFACNDAEAIASLLQDPKCGGFDSVTKILDNNANREHILNEIDALFYDPSLTQDDLILIYYSGHGALDKGDNLFLTPCDVNFLADSSVNLTTTIHIKDLEIRVDNTKVGYIVIILDACHGGASGKLLGQIKYRDTRNIILVGAARYSEKAWETPEFQQSRFTNCLLNAVNDRPMLGEWITLPQVLTFVQTEMQKLGDSQTMEVSSHVIDSNICLFKNPLYSLNSQNFTNEIQELCKLVGYQILSMQPNQAIPNLFIARERLGFGRPSQMLVMCLDNATIDIVEAHIVQFRTLFQSLQRDGQVTNGMVITRNELPGSLKKLLTPLLVVEARTKDELQRSLIDFDRYLNRLVTEFEKPDSDRYWDPPIKDYYIELDAKNLGCFTEREPITKCIEQWLMSANQPVAIILGGYGTGKTTFSKKITYDLARAYLMSHDKRDHRIPVLLYLRDFPKAEVDIEAFIIAHLKRRCQVMNPDFNAFQEMNDAGLFLLVFDGFDEMVVRADEDTIRRNLAAIERFAVNSNAKILLTSRPEFFRSVQEEKNLLVSDTVLTVKRPRYERIALLPLSQEQVELYLQKRIPLIKEGEQIGKDWTYYRDQIYQISGFSDLTRRPVLLEMIVKTLPELIAQQEEINRASLYNRYLRSEIDRQQVQKQRKLLIKQEDRFHLMQVIARHFYTENPSGLTAEQIQNLLKDEFSSSQREELEAHIRDFLSASFLIREGDQYRFSHRSIMEYLAAKDLADEIEQGNPKVFQSFKLTSEVRDFLIDLKPDPDSSWRKTLYAWIRSTAGKEKSAAGYLGGNAVTVLNFMKESFVGANFQDTVLGGANLRRARCREACFQRANLDAVDLSECDLTGADLTDVVWKTCMECGKPIGIEGGDYCLYHEETRMQGSAPDINLLVRGAMIGNIVGVNAKLRDILLKLGAIEKTGQVQEIIDSGDSSESMHCPELICPTCSTPNVHDAITCSTCGTNINSKPEPAQYICSICEAVMTPGTRFCGMCGALFSRVQCCSCGILNPSASFKCHSCNTELPSPQRMLCQEAPTRIADPLRFCSACGALNSADSQYCEDCNHELRKKLSLDRKPRASSVSVELLGQVFDWIKSLSVESQNEPTNTKTGETSEVVNLSSRHFRTSITGIVLPGFPRFTADELSPETLLGDHYRILRVQARGGFNIVYLAEDIINLRQCIIKQALTQRSDTPDAYPWEAMQLSRLKYPGLPEVYDVVIETGKWYSVVEYIEGRTLQDILNGSLDFSPETQLFGWVTQMCDLLEYLHNQQPPLIVRDIKPGNFVVHTGSDRVVLVDLSASRIYKPGKVKDTVVLGTPGYAPPEQYGRTQTDVRSDIYSLGVTIHQLLTRINPEPSTQRLFEFIPVLEVKPNFSPGWDHIISRATQSEPDKRYQSILELKQDLANRVFPHKSANSEIEDNT